MEGFKSVWQIVASTLIIATFCSTVVQVNGQCERCGILFLGCCLEDDYQCPASTSSVTVTATTTQHQTATVTSTEYSTETQIQTLTTTEHATVTEISTETATATVTEAQPPSTVISTSTETVTETTTEEVTAVETVTEVETVREVDTQEVTQTVTEAQNVTLMLTETVTSTEQDVQTVTETETVSNTATLECATSASLLDKVSDCPTSVTTLTESVIVSESPSCSGQTGALDANLTPQSFGSGAIAAVALAVILTLATIVCSVAWVVCIKNNRKKKDHMMDPVHLMRMGTSGGASSSDGDAKAVSACNPVYATCDTLTSVTAGMVESLDDEPPGYSTVEMNASCGVKYVNAPRGKLPRVPEGANLTTSQMNDYDVPSASEAVTVESTYSTVPDLYWIPATTLEELRKQLKQMDGKSYCRIDPQQVSLSSRLGAGEFGEVYKGALASRHGAVEVAVKTLHHKEKGKGTETSNGRVDLLKEAATMGQFNHPNVVGLHGVVDTTDTVMLVMEFLPGGDLKGYLKSAAESPLEVDPLRLLKWCQDIASAMGYLSKKGFIHRDLAARNILMDCKDQCKIADFGMSRDLEQEYYYKPKGGRIPIKWTAPEAILYRKYTTKSDVWSYGMVMYEIWSLGHRPFDTWTTEDLVKAISSGYCLPPPPGCPRGVYNLMVECWHPDYHQRVSFDNLTTLLAETPTSLLAWTEEDRATAPQASVIGAPLEEGTALFQDLQKKYNGAQV